MISGAILARNEERNIVDCIHALRPHVKQLILIDMESEDRTVELAEPLVDQVLTHELVANFDSARNIAIDAAQYEWLWYIDADERVPESTGVLVNRLLEEQSDQFEAINIPFKTYFCGEWIQHSGWWPGYTMPRVLKKGYFQFSRRLHGGVELSGREIRVPADPALGIDHYSYQSIEHYLEKLNRYTSTEAKQLSDDGQPRDWRYGVGHMVHDLWMYYEANQGRLDRRRGWLLAWLSGQYRWLSHAKLLDQDNGKQDEPHEYPESLDQVLEVMESELERVRSRRPQLPLGVVFRSPIYDYSGYADEGRCLARSLSYGSRRLQMQEIRWSEDRCPLKADEASILKSLSAARRHGSNLTITNCIPSLAEPDPAAALNVIRTTFETDRIPADWLQRLEQFDEVWVISEHNKRAFQRSGVAPERLRVVPSLLDTQRFTDQGPVYDLPQEVTGRFVFLSIFDWQLRKGWDKLLQSYCLAFQADEGAGLFLKISRAHGHSLETCKRQADQALGLVGTSLDQRPDIVVTDEKLEPEALASLYRAADAFVLPSRGEGWGRPLMEAMASGLPVIGIGASGNADFMTNGNSLLVEAELVPVPAEAAAEIPPYAGHQWYEPDAVKLAQAMRRLRDDPQLRERLRLQTQADIRSKYGLEQAAPRLDAAVSAAEQRLVVPDLPAPKPEQIRLVWDGEIFAGHSFANVNEHLIRQFVQDDSFAMRVERRVHNPPQESLASDRGLLTALTGRDLQSEPHITVRHAFPPNWERPASGVWVHIQPWEFGHLPQDWVPPLRDAVDECWVPSSYVKRVFENSGIPSEKIQVIPWGVDEALFNANIPARLLPTSKSFRFLFVGGTIERKGYDRLLQAYLEEFSPQDDVCLVVKDLGTSTFYRYGNQKDATIAASEDEKQPEIIYFDDDWTPGQLAGLYTACNCLAMPYRGEGFGLPILEAMACGTPAIVPRGGASDDFVNDTNGVFVNASEVETQHDWPLVGPALELEVKVSDIRRALRRAYENREGLKCLGAKAAKDVAAHFTWNHAYAKMRERLLELTHTSLVPPSAASSNSNWAAVIESHNSERSLPGCLARLAPFAQQLIVVDDNSSDRSPAIAAEYGARVITRGDGKGLIDDLAPATTVPWAVWVDAETFLSEGESLQLVELCKSLPAATNEMTLTMGQRQGDDEESVSQIRLQRSGGRGK